VNAGRLLRAAGLDTDGLRDLIAPVDPDEVNVWPASTWMRALWRPGIQGVTHWKWVFVDPEVLTGERMRLGRLVVHELVHVRQFVAGGYVRFVIRYVGEYVRGRLTGKSPRDAYLAISAEVEAREVVRGSF